MRTTRRVTATMIALTTLIVSSASALAQDRSLDSAVPPVQWSDCIVSPVFEAPFSAEAVTAWHPPTDSGKPELRVTARYYRDRAGRVRVDFVEGMGQERVIVTRGAESNQAYELDTAKRMAFKTGRRHVAAFVGGGCGDRFLVPVLMNRFVSFRGTPLPDEFLGTRSMEGLQVSGTRFNTRPPLNFNGMMLPGERWVSPELKVVVYSRLEDSVVGVVEYQFRKISRTEPPADLFELPTNYTVPTGPYGCWMWDNPYAPHFGRPGRCDRR